MLASQTIKHCLQSSRRTAFDRGKVFWTHAFRLSHRIMKIAADVPDHLIGLNLKCRELENLQPVSDVNEDHQNGPCLIKSALSWTRLCSVVTVTITEVP